MLVSPGVPSVFRIAPPKGFRRPVAVADRWSSCRSVAVPDRSPPTVAPAPFPGRRHRVAAASAFGCSSTAERHVRLLQGSKGCQLTHNRPFVTDAREIRHESLDNAAGQRLFLAGIIGLGETCASSLVHGCLCLRRPHVVQKPFQRQAHHGSKCRKNSSY